MTLFRATLAYDGTDFEGFQLQAGRRPARTVQGELEAALARLSAGALVRVSGAGRTDAGVHALGQVVSFELTRPFEPADLCRALNGMLSPDLRVLAAELASPDFHARRSARSKLYRYELDFGPVQLPTRRRYVSHSIGVLDETQVIAAAALFLGRHDFASLASSGSTVQTTVRTVSRSEVEFADTSLRYEVEADGFLRKMVRSLVGGLIAAGRGLRSVEDLARALEARDRRAWPAPAEARGLTLVRVDYVSTVQERDVGGV